MNNDEIYELFRPYFEMIWERGETKKGTHLCFIPGKDDKIIEKFDVTHFTLKWNIKGYCVCVTLYQGDSFGACMDMDFKGNFLFIVNNSCDGSLTGKAPECDSGSYGFKSDPSPHFFKKGNFMKTRKEAIEFINSLLDDGRLKIALSRDDIQELLDFIYGKE